MAICYVYVCARLSFSLQTCLIWLHTVGRSPVTPEFQISMHNLRRSLSLSESLSLSCYVPFYFTRFAAHFESTFSLLALSACLCVISFGFFSHISLFAKATTNIMSCSILFFFPFILPFLFLVGSHCSILFASSFMQLLLPLVITYYIFIHFKKKYWPLLYYYFV